MQKLFEKDVALYTNPKADSGKKNPEPEGVAVADVEAQYPSSHLEKSTPPGTPEGTAA